MPKYTYIMVDSLENVTQVDIKDISIEKGIIGVYAGDRLVQYGFDLINQDAGWNPESILQYIQKRGEKFILQSLLSAEIMEPVKQASYLTDAVMMKLKAVDPDPFFVPIHIKYGLGSRKQYFDREFFEKAGPKFEGTPLMVNHSDLVEFGKAIPVGSNVKYAGADASQATFIAYVSGSEGTLRQKIRESQALGDKGFVKKVSIEGIPASTDYTVEKETGIKHFHDLQSPTGIAIVIKEGLKGSEIGG